MQYLPLIKALRGQGAMLEVGDMTRQSIEVVHGMIWDVFFQDSLLLLIIYKDEAVEQARPEPPPGQPVPPKTFRTVREFTFKWIRVANVVAVVSDADILLERETRTLLKSQHAPLYTDSDLFPKNSTGWHVVNNGICRKIVNKLRGLGLEGTFPGAFRNDQNESITFAEAFAPPVVPQPAPVIVNSAPTASQTNGTAPAATVMGGF